MKICIVTTGYPRWQGDFNSIYIQYLVRELVHKEYIVHIVAPHAPGLAKEEHIGGVYIHRFQYIWPSKLQSLAYFPGIPENIKKLHNKLQVIPFALSMAVRLLIVVRKYKIDIINAHWALPAGFWAVLLKKYLKRPVATKLYGADLHMIKHKYPALKPILKYVISNSDKVIANSGYTRQVACSLFDFDSSVINVIPDGVDINYFTPSVNGEKLKRQYHLDGFLLVLSCGRMVERKGFEFLIRAMPGVIEKNPNVRLLLVGDGPEKDRLHNLVTSLSIDRYVIFAGKVADSELPDYYRMSDVFVLPAIIDANGDTEGLGLVILEAMSTGKPVIGSDIGGIPYIFEGDYHPGYLVASKDVVQLSDRLNKLLSDKKLCKTMGEEGRKMVEQKYSWSNIADQYDSLWKLLDLNSKG
jgi:N-acetyl-alpha-D-glucosaminyl L-malate synthase BshA